MTLNKQAQQARREYQKEWRKRNPDKVRKSNQRYWEKKALEMEAIKHDREIDTNS